MVRPSGVEPPLLSEHGPEPCASANSATGAQSIGGPEISRASGVVKNRTRPARFEFASPSCALRDALPSGALLGMTKIHNGERRRTSSRLSQVLSDATPPPSAWRQHEIRHIAGYQTTGAAGRSDGGPAVCLLFFCCKMHLPPPENPAARGVSRGFAVLFLQKEQQTASRDGHSNRRQHPRQSAAVAAASKTRDNGHAKRNPDEFSAAAARRRLR